jgi:hypothetical protein
MSFRKCQCYEYLVTTLNTKSVKCDGVRAKHELHIVCATAGIMSAQNVLPGACCALAAGAIYCACVARATHFACAACAMYFFCAAGSNIVCAQQVLVIVCVRNTLRIV